jgi:transcriptional regulator with XRE-family HTH domain
MENSMNTNSDLWQKLRNKEYRSNFVALQLKRGVPFQIRALLKKREWTQEQLAESANLTQGVVSRAQNPDYGNLTINTISRIASGFDVAFVGQFVSFGRLVEWFENLSEESGNIETFEREYSRIVPSNVRSMPRRRGPQRHLMVVVPRKRDGIPIAVASAGAVQLRLPLPEAKPERLEIVRKVLNVPPRGDIGISNKFQGAPAQEAGRRLAGGLNG